MHTGLEELPDGFERMAAYYAERAAGGVGMIITGGIAPNPEGGMTMKDGDGNEVFAASKLQNEKEVEGHAIVTKPCMMPRPTANSLCKFCMWGRSPIMTKRLRPRRSNRALALSRPKN